MFIYSFSLLACHIYLVNFFSLMNQNKLNQAHMLKQNTTYLDKHNDGYTQTRCQRCYGPPTFLTFLEPSTDATLFCVTKQRSWCSPWGLGVEGGWESCSLGSSAWVMWSVCFMNFIFIFVSGTCAFGVGVNAWSWFEFHHHRFMSFIFTLFFIPVSWTASPSLPHHPQIMIMHFPPSNAPFRELRPNPDTQKHNNSESYSWHKLANTLASQDLTCSLHFTAISLQFSCYIVGAAIKQSTTASMALPPLWQLPADVHSVAQCISEPWNQCCPYSLYFLQWQSS